MRRRRILIIEDDAAIRQGIVDALEFSNYTVIEAADGNTGLEQATQADYDLLLLDLILPGLDGLKILREVRASRATIPVIILTARGEEADRISGLKLGADDYVVKPFSVNELLARVEAVLRRSPERPREVTQITIPSALIDLSKGMVQFKDGTQIELSELERELIAYLAANRSRAVSRDELLSRVWRVNPRGVETRTVDMHIARLREKLRDNASEPAIILTARGKGYFFTSAVFSQRGSRIKGSCASLVS
jgi:DNA-binding response OmpR family regulator